MNIQKLIEDNTGDLSGKTIAITGSTGGLTGSLVKVLAGLGANLILLNRNKEKTQRQIDELLTLYPNIKIDFIQCNLSNFESIKTATHMLKQKQIDILYLAAGVYNVKRFKTDLDYDNVFQTNFVSHYYMAKELMNNIKTSNGKIVAISSIAHNYSKIDAHDIDFSSRKKHSKVYGNSKRFLMFSLMELCKRENVNLSIVHPGLTLTEMTNHYPKAINWLVKIFIKFFCPNTQKASLSLIKGVFDNTTYHRWIGPSFLQVYGKLKKIKLKSCTESESKMIFEIAEDIYNHIKEEG
ncbi:MAG: SDR family NAD(P)-dependent oxidoreductase [Clostridia bacterium]|nr:SDR family NAD(P)-dependent oxidoreductase [Clostridia bacterium]